MTLICHIFRNNNPLPKYLTDRKLKMSAVFIYEIKGAKRGGVTIRNYAETCKDICGYNSVCNVFVYLLPLKSSAFMMHFSDAF